LTTHYMDEAQYLADHVAILVEGRIVAEGPPSTLTHEGAAPTKIAFWLQPGASLPSHLEDGAAVHEGRVELETTDPTRTLHELTGWAIDAGVELEGWSVTRPSLEDVYLELTRTVEE
ncbi:MAG: ABC transporter ATP-binding protein, partial [Actinomycetota bacterium]